MLNPKPFVIAIFIALVGVMMHFGGIDPMWCMVPLVGWMGLMALFCVFG